MLVELDGDPKWAVSDLVIKSAIAADGIDTFGYNRFARSIRSTAPTLATKQPP